MKFFYYITDVQKRKKINEILKKLSSYYFSEKNTLKFNEGTFQLPTILQTERTHLILQCFHIQS